MTEQKATATRPVKKVEIIAATVEVRKVLELLEELGVSGYTLIREAEGMGDRGHRLADEVTDVFTNSYIMVCCTPELAERISHRIQPRIKKYGGACIVSDAVWVRHRDERSERDEP